MKRIIQGFIVMGMMGIAMSADASSLCAPARGLAAQQNYHTMNSL